MKELETSRKCILSGEVKEKEDLLRFVLSPEGIVIPDFKKKLPGKAVYVSNSKEALSQVVAKKLFTKGFKQSAKADENLVELVESILKKKGLDSINLARKAGILVTGFEKVSEVLKKGKVAFVMEALGAGSDGHHRIVLLAKGLEIFVLYSVEELDKALDRVNTVHIAFIKGDMAKMVHSDCKRLEAFLGFDKMEIKK